MSHVLNGLRGMENFAINWDLFSFTFFSLCTCTMFTKEIHNHMQFDFSVGNVTKIYQALKKSMCSDWGWVLSCKPKGHRFDSQWGHMPGLWARSLLGGKQEATDQCFSVTSMFLSLFLPFPHFLKKISAPWLVWLSGLSASLQTKGLLVQFPVRAHAWIVGQVPSGGHVRGNHTLMFLSLSFSLLSPLSKNK